MALLIVANALFMNQNFTWQTFESIRCQYITKMHTLKFKQLVFLLLTAEGSDIKSTSQRIVCNPSSKCYDAKLEASKWPSTHRWVTSQWVYTWWWCGKHAVLQRKTPFWVEGDLNFLPCSLSILLQKSSSGETVTRQRHLSCPGLW